ncbi:MAG: hypothetical protein H8E54_11165 [Candidatus Aminicenantes bacterium]|nr:hypothetical protein [Candidatus Aminicenantes bacterium]
MSEKPEQDPRQPKKPYRKPELKQVPLRPEEAVLGFCKNKNTKGPGVGSCRRPVACYRQGS